MVRTKQELHRFETLGVQLVGFFKRQPEIGAAILIALCVTTVVVVFFPEGHPLNDWLYRWSTLVGGLAAVVAAFVTVSEMRMSQVEQSQNHRELVALGLRVEAVAARKNIQEFLALLLRRYNKVHDLTGKLEVAVKNAMESELGSSGVNYLEAMPIQQNLATQLQEFFRFQESREFANIYPILNAEQITKVLALTNAVGNMANEVGSPSVFLTAGDDSNSWLLGGANSLTKMTTLVQIELCRLQYDLHDLQWFYVRNSPQIF
ncbi:MAG: hypothetical protein ABJM29_17375 [Rhizobiaceae bacterium]